jgi:hypothetical protein
MNLAIHPNGLKGHRLRCHGSDRNAGRDGGWLCRRRNRYNPPGSSRRRRRIFRHKDL